MGRSSKSISLVLIGPALLGSTIAVTGCAPAVEEEAVQWDWVVAEGDERGDNWGTPEQIAQESSHAGSTTHSGHRGNVGGLIGGFLGARAASSASRGGVAPAPSRGGTSTPSHVGTPSSRGGFGSSAGHSSASS
ncbi:hypothetical protein TA3x_001970 [Tundrisphaera sp. TA3]|uniref:hypothetical protein n=1 Tax=Tundrisphaera sp. TA3 TaxID=3435775 RepID=UPI003EBEF421